MLKEIIEIEEYLKANTFVDVVWLFFIKYGNAVFMKSGNSTDAVKTISIELQNLFGEKYSRNLIKDEFKHANGDIVRALKLDINSFSSDLTNIARRLMLDEICLTLIK